MLASRGMQPCLMEKPIGVTLITLNNVSQFQLSIPITEQGTGLMREHLGGTLIHKATG